MISRADRAFKAACHRADKERILFVVHLMNEAQIDVSVERQHQMSFLSDLAIAINRKWWFWTGSVESCKATSRDRVITHFPAQEVVGIQEIWPPFCDADEDQRT